jgi:predicted flap endonuclease-1-like 5' DNA nuclease
MENRCKQYEEDARRYRNQAEESEKQSDTLRFKMGDIEKNFHEMQSKEKKKKKKSSGNGKVDVSVNMPPAFGLKEPDGEVDDLTEIIGIGKVFERTLHDLGIWHFRQIAAFGPAEIARINSELKEFKGRIEHDDWIGQAKELQFKKYGEQ